MSLLHGCAIGWRLKFSRCDAICLSKMLRRLLSAHSGVDGLEETERWVLSLGTHAAVVLPGRLRERLFEATEELWQRYGGPMVLHD